MSGTVLGPETNDEVISALREPRVSGNKLMLVKSKHQSLETEH